uniref:Uncharacterized protein n=1 Tax=viral metagenome TaxID=1070528 RepID=A0A6C0CNX4_9ZZZZ
MQYNNFVDSFLDVPRLVVLPNLEPDSRVILTEKDMKVPLDTNICDAATKEVGGAPNEVIGTISPHNPGDFKNNCKKYLYFKNGDSSSPLMQCRFRAKNKCGKKGKSGMFTKAADVTWKLWELDLSILGAVTGSKGTFTVTIKNKKLSFMLDIKGGKYLPPGQYPVYIWDVYGGIIIDQTVANVLDVINAKSGGYATTLYQNALNDDNFFKLDLKLKDIRDPRQRELVNTQLKLFKVAISAGLYKYLMCFDKSPQPWSIDNVNGNGRRPLENKFGQRVRIIKEAMVMASDNSVNPKFKEIIEAQFTPSSQSSPGSPRSVADPSVITIEHDPNDPQKLMHALQHENKAAAAEGRSPTPVTVTGGKRKTRKQKKRNKKKKTRKYKKKKTRKQKKRYKKKKTRKY